MECSALTYVAITRSRFLNVRNNKQTAQDGVVDAPSLQSLIGRFKFMPLTRSSPSSARATAAAVDEVDLPTIFAQPKLTIRRPEGNVTIEEGYNSVPLELLASSEHVTTPPPGYASMSQLAHALISFAGGAARRPLHRTERAKEGYVRALMIRARDHVFL
jgi:hypothetical protein